MTTRAKPTTRDERTGIVACGAYAYKSAIPVAIGDVVRVTVDRAFAEHFGPTTEATVTGFDTDYDGRYGWQSVVEIVRKGKPHAR